MNYRSSFIYVFLVKFICRVNLYVVLKIIFKMLKDCAKYINAELHLSSNAIYLVLIAINILIWHFIIMTRRKFIGINVRGN